MLSLAIVFGSIAAYLFSVCLVCATLIRINPWGEFSGHSSDMPANWIISAVWPISVPIMTAVVLVSAICGPLMSWIGGHMDGFVTWLTKPRPKKERKSELPRAEVRK